MEIVSRVPELRFHTGDGSEFPDWEEKRLKDMGEIVNGLTYTPDNISDDGVLVLRSSNIQNGSLSFDDNVYVSVDKFNPLQENDILICVRNGSKRLIGKNAIIPKSSVGIAFGAFMTVFRGESNLFIHQSFQTRTFKWNVHRNLGATINSINGGDLKKMKFLIPSLPEQNKIADFLSTVDETINALTRRYELLQKYKKGMLQKLFPRKGESVPELRFKADDGSEFPDWEVKRLNQVSVINKDGKELPDHFVYIDLESVKDGILVKQSSIFRKDAPSRAQRVLDEGDILFQMVRPYQQNNLLYNMPGDYVASTGYAQIKSSLDTRYLYYSIHTYSFLVKVLRRCTGTSYPAINSKDLASIPLYISTYISEQKKIADFLSKIDDQLKIVGQQIEQMKTWKRGLLQKMFV